MDDAFTYLLSGLLTRSFGLGRIARFRQVARGRQAATYEVLTAQQNEYVVYLYPATFSAERLAFVASAINRLDEVRFSVVPFLKTKAGAALAEGPQGTHMLVGLGMPGSAQAAKEWTDQQRSDLGLRLAWMHKALREELPTDADGKALADELEESRGLPAERLPKNLPPIASPDWDALAAELANGAGALAHIHGDLSPDAAILDGDHQLRCLLDWGLMRPGLPAEDLAWVFWHWCGGDTEPMRPVLEAYGTLEAFDPRTAEAAMARAIARRIVEARAGRAAIRPAVEMLGRRKELVAGLQKACR